MIKTYQELLENLSNYQNPKMKISRMVKDKELYKITSGLYSTEAEVDKFMLAPLIYGPSYISFQTALSYYDLIPDVAFNVTSATLSKHRTKIFKTTVGLFFYRDIPDTVYSDEIIMENNNGYYYFIGSREKVLCDMIYIYSPVKTYDDFIKLLFEDLRLNEPQLKLLDFNKIIELSNKYHTTNHKWLIKYSMEALNGK